MSDLPAWESVKECSKCGEGRFIWGEMVGMSTMIMAAYSCMNQEFKSRYRRLPNFEGIWVTCPRCGHGWWEKTKDASNG